jgi:hypothetical protein
MAEVDDPPVASFRRGRAVTRPTPRALVGLGEHAQAVQIDRLDHQQVQ